MRVHRASFVMLVFAGLASGCFALFSLDGYGPPGEIIDGGVAEAARDGAVPRDAADAEVPGHVIFVTSGTTQGDLGGIDGGDVRCQLAAVDAGLGGRFVAWLSGPSNDATDRLVADAGPLRLRDGTIVARTLAELTALGPQVGIDLDEHVRRLDGDCDGGLVAWTGALADGGVVPGANCNSWMSNGQAGAVVGEIGATKGKWSAGCFRACNTQAALYCIER